MKTIKSLGEMLTGKNREDIPNIAFRVMTAIMKLMDILGKYSSKKFETLDLKPGQIVIDYGCGPARYIEKASRAIGDSGRLIAVDIHPLAIKKVKEKIDKYNLMNVEAVLATGYDTSIDDGTADVVFSLDVFHMIKTPTEFLAEISRLLKQDGIAIIEDGHQPRSKTKQKIEKSEVLRIVEETKFHVKCKKSL